jgi:RNA polymerase sigma-70 factor (ECF subfamily)
MPADDSAQLAGLLARCAARDAGALEQLYRVAAPRLLGCLLKILRRRALAEEALQDVFVQVWQRAAQYEEHRGRPWAWLLSTARYRAIDILRRERAEPTDPFEIAQTLADTSRFAGPGPALDPVPAADGAVLERCLGELATEQRDSIRLAYLDGRTHPQIAQAMDRPLGSVKSWIRRGLVALRECIEACDARATH